MLRYHPAVGGLGDLLFPYKVKRTFGAASFALVFLMLVAEVELLVAIALGIVAHRFDLFMALQPVVLPGACLIALSTTVVFWWRARSWAKSRVEMVDLWAGGGTAFGERLAAKTRPQQ